MAREIRCGELMPGCDYVARAETDEELLEKVVAHARNAHGVEEITPELGRQVRSAIRDA